MAKIIYSFILVCSIFLCDGYSQQSDIRDCVRDTYTKEIGVRELTGRNDGPRVQEYLATTGNKGNVPWCAAFLTWTLGQHCLPTPKSLPAYSPSWFPASRVIDKEDARHGDVFGVYFASKKRIAHVGFIDSKTDTYFITVEGNTGDTGSVDEVVREGDGVYKKRRIKRQVYKVSNWID